MLQQIHNLKKNNFLINLAALIYLTQKWFLFIFCDMKSFELTSEGEGDCRHKNHDAP